MTEEIHGAEGDEGFLVASKQGDAVLVNIARKHFVSYVEEVGGCRIRYRCQRSPVDASYEEREVFASAGANPHVLKIVKRWAANPL